MAKSLEGGAFLRSYLFALSDNQLISLREWQKERFTSQDSSSPCPTVMVQHINAEMGRRGMCLPQLTKR